VFNMGVWGGDAWGGGRVDGVDLSGPSGRRGLSRPSGPSVDGD
jgi:hypothetical protein